MFRQRHRMGILQKRALLDIVEETFYFIQGKHDVVRGHMDKQSSWRIIAGKLNKMGPIRKEPHEWRKAWCCMKSKVREKYKKLKLHTLKYKEGGFEGDHDLDRITEEDWRVIKMCSITKLEIEQPKPASFGNEIIFVDPNLVIKTDPTTSDDEENVTITTSQPVRTAPESAKQLAEMPRKPNLKKPDLVAPKPKLNEPVMPAKKLPNAMPSPKINKPVLPPMATVSLQLAAIAKSLQMHNDTQRIMVKEMQENNRLQKNMISLLTDIKMRLPQ